MIGIPKALWFIPAWIGMAISVNHAGPFNWSTRTMGVTGAAGAANAVGVYKAAHSPAPAVPTSGPVTEWSVESFDAGGLNLLWRNPNPGGAPNPAGYSSAIAIAPGTTASAVVVSTDGKTPAAEGTVSVSPPSRYRDVNIAAVTWTPKGASGPARAPLSARIRILFKAGNQAATRSAFPPPADNAAELALASWIVNYPQSRNLRSTPAAALGKSAADGPSAGAALAKQRLMIRTRGDNIEVLTYADLVKVGVPVGSIDPRIMHLYRDGIEAPLYIDGEDDGRWDPGDFLEFIGRRPSGQNTFNSLYSTASIFILTWDGGRIGMRAPRVPVASRTGGIVPLDVQLSTLAKPFNVHEHVEQDLEILRIGSTSVEEIVDLGSKVQEAELTDFWFWKRLGTDKDNTEILFGMGYTPSAQAPGTGSSGQSGTVPSSGSLRVTINLKGITNNPNADPDHHLKFLLNGTDISLIGGVNHDAIWEGQESYTWVSPPINPGILKAGDNKLIIQKVNDLKTSDGQLVENQDAYLNYMEFDFPANYQVHDDNLRFSNSFPDSIGTKLYTLTGFTSDAVSIWDKQGRKLANFRVSQQGGGYQVSFLDSLAGPTEYIAATLDKREVPAIILDTLPDLLNPAQGADYIVITQRTLLGSALDSLVDFRRKQGLRCAVVMADHIYQAFGDGSMDPAAIRRFVAYAYKNWPRPAPTYLCIVGDASLWFEKRGGATQVTTVPTHLVNIRGWGVAADDDYFAKVSGDDDVADLFVGRIPVTAPEDLSKVVHKTILLETARPEGHWHNQAFLISGFESSFTAQNYVLQSIAAGNDRQITRLDLFPGSPHYKSAAQRTDFYDQIDSGYNLVSFIGHGGGAVWSDAGVLTLKALDEGRLKGEFPIPLVSSVTCLTGYFEDVAARSLGEEMIRLDKGGAAGFYGAAGYISGLAGEALSSEVLKAATGNAYGTTGAIVGQAETMVKLRTGDAFLPILAEFNLLGDPALHMSFPSKEGAVTLKPQVLAGTNDLQAKAASLPIAEADGVATIYLDDSLESDSQVRVNQGGFDFDRKLNLPLGSVQNGKVVVHYWSEKQGHVLSAPFSTLDWLIDSVSFRPADAAPGDSVKIRIKLNTAYAKVAFGAGVASYVIGGDVAPLFPGENQSGFKSDDGSHLETTNWVGLPVPTADLANPRLYLAFRLNVQILDSQGQPTQSIANLSSRTYSLPLANLASLELANQAFRLPIQDKLGVWVAFHNKGLGTATGFRIAMTRDAENAAPVLDTLTYTGKLAFGGMDSLFFTMADSMLAGKRLRASLIASRDGEVAVNGSSQDTVFKIRTAGLLSPSDSLRLDTNGASLTLAASASKSHRLFSRNVSITSLPAYLSSVDGTLPLTAFQIETDSSTGSNFEISQAVKTSLPKTAAPLSKTAADAIRPYWHYRDAQGSTWLKLDTLPGSGPPWTAKGLRSGLYALLINKDVTAPIIQLSSRGQVLLPDDYVPLHTPIDITIRDGQGVDLVLHPPVMTSHEQSLDSLNHAQESGNPFPTLARINFLPQHKADRDSLEIFAEDVSGNIARRTLVYRLGDALSIRDLGSYPNPFADTATFVFSLTDYSDKVDLKVYSRAGRLVRTLQERNVVGYQEVVWDGRAEGDREIANGLYFLKVTAKAGGKETSRIFKLFKKKRK